MAWLFAEYEKRLREHPPTQADLSELRRPIAYLQHERLLHLLVMLTVGLATLVTYLFSLLTEQWFLTVPALMLSILFVAYLFYYRKLENTVQSWYKSEERILKDNV